MQKIPSGIEGFDKISKGGVPKKGVTVILGPHSSGKTTFGVQFLVGGILKSNEPAVFITLDETPNKIKMKMKGYGWDLLEYINKGLWDFVDLSPHLGEKFEFRGDYNLGGLLIQIKMAIDKIKAKRIVLDSLSVLYNRFPNTEIIKRDLLVLKSWLKAYSVTSIIINEMNDEIPEDFHHKIVRKTSDNIIRLKNPLNTELRTIEIVKYQDNNYLKGKHFFTIEKRRGITIIPTD
jgi:circadian clock protein KaiC